MNLGISDTILGRGADNLLALKSNRKSLHAEVAMQFEQATGLAAHEITDADHGRIETRRAWISHDVDWLRPDRAEPGLHRFPGLAAIGMVKATVDHKGQTTIARRCFLSSAPFSAAALLHATRAHRGARIRLHWIMDVVFHDDPMRLRTHHGPANMALVHHTALNAFKNATSKISLKNRRKLAAWDDACLFSTITGHQ